MQHAQRREALGGDPQADVEARRTARVRELAEPARPAGPPFDILVADDAETDQRLVHLVGAARCRPGFVAHAGDRVGVEPAESSAPPTPA